MPPLEIIDQAAGFWFPPLPESARLAYPGRYFITGTRVSLDSVVYAFLRGDSPEGIAESFPVLGLEQIFGALAFYMENREIVDHYLREGQQEFEALRKTC